MVKNMIGSEDNLIVTANWEIWYQDSFDIETPRKIELSGVGLIKGLNALWARHLYETVQLNGFLGFTRFNLWWKQRQCSIEIVGETRGQVKIRNWVYEGRRLSDSKYLDIADAELLVLIAETHARLILHGKTSEAIVMTAYLLNNRDDFIEQIN